jgi:predicted acylesterase/phospholipase RssA
VAAVLLARRRLVESRTPGRRRIPDLLGALLLAIAIAALVLGIVKGQEWGWGSVRIVSCFVAALAAGAAVIWRCTWHRSPIIDLSLLKVRTFSAANAMTVIGAAGFYGYTLANVLFLTGLWRYSVLEAGLALTIGPAVAVAVAGPTSRLAQRIGPRPVLVAGGLWWGGALLWFVERVGTTPDFPGQWLPGMVLLGIGAGTLFPNLSGTAVASAPGKSFATATGMNSVARQIGAALGVAVVVAIIGTPRPATAFPAFQHAWTFGAICLFVAGLGCLLVGRVDTSQAPPLGDAARVVLAETEPLEPVKPPRPRPRRMIAPDIAEPGAPRAESAADFLAQTPLFSDIDPELRKQLAAKSRTRHEVPPPAASTEPATRYGPLIDRAEAGHDLVLLVGGVVLQPGPWMGFCLQQADRILAVTRGGPVPGELAKYPELQGCDLVVYDVAAGELEGWAGALNPVESHVIREAEFDADIARTARRLSGTSLGIVLSGGGARAFSHIGVLEELTAVGATIDRVAGVSMGAVIGAMFAMGHDADEMDEICFEEWVQRRPLGDYTVPRHSLIRGERFRAMLHRTFGTRLIEELPRSFMCGSTELRSGRLEIARHGPLWEAVSFSICLPVIAPPQIRGREMFIDGSLVDNLPVRALADMGEGPIIAVDVKATFDRSANGPAVARTRDDRAPRTPSLGETLTRVLLLGSENTTVAAQRHADLVIKPRVEGIGLLEFHQLDSAREAGRAAARRALEQAPAGFFA